MGSDVIVGDRHPNAQPNFFPLMLTLRNGVVNKDYGDFLFRNGNGITWGNPHIPKFLNRFFNTLSHDNYDTVLFFLSPS